MFSSSPPQPSAPNPPQLASSLGNQKDFKDTQRLTTAEVASSIIISNPGLTGKHIAAMTNTTQQQQQAPPPSPLYHHHHHPAMAYSSSSSSITSPSTSQPNPVVPPELLPPSASSVLNLPPSLPQQLVGGADVGAAGWAYSSQHHNSNHHMFPSPAALAPTANPGSPLSAPASALGGPPAPPTVGGAGKDILSQQQQQQHSNGFKPRLEPASVPHSPLAGGAVQSSAMDIGLLTSPGQGTNSSPRPRILRGKRAVDG